MKKFILFFVMLVSLSFLVRSQEMEMIPAHEAFNYLNSENIFLDYELISIQAYEISGEMMYIDFDRGTTNVWAFVTKSKDTTDKTGYLFIVFKMAGQMFAELETNTDTDYQSIPALNSEFATSPDFGKKLMAEPEFKTFYETNKDLIVMKMMSVGYDYGISVNVWSGALYVNQDNLISCYFQVLDLNTIGCEMLTKVNEIVQRKIQSYPNPATEFIKPDLTIAGLSTVNIYDELGNLVKSMEMDLGENSYINVRDLVNGVYQLRINTGGNLYQNVFVVNR